MPVQVLVEKISYCNITFFITPPLSVRTKSDVCEAQREVYRKREVGKVCRKRKNGKNEKEEGTRLVMFHEYS